MIPGISFERGDSMVDGKELGNAGFKYLGTPYSQMDCQAFVERCLADCGCHKDLAGSNAWYREVYNNGAIMSPEECVNTFGCVPKGAFLFIQAFDGGEPAKYKGDGLGNASHIGLVTMPRGEGAIHSSASRGCVAESVFKGKTIKNGGWNKVGLWNQVSYDYGGDTPTPSTTPEPTPTPTPTPEPTQTATVGNVPDGNKQRVNLRKRPSIKSALVDRVPCGETVEILNDEGEWSQVRWKNETGYMMSTFLIKDQELVSVLIPDIPFEEAENLIRMYPGAEIWDGEA